MSLLRGTLTAGCLALALLGCEDDVPRTNQRGLGVAGRGAAPAPVAGAAQARSASAAWTVLRDTDFVESEANRDPFRNFSRDVKVRVPIAAQRTVIMPSTQVKAMRLIAIVTGIDQPRAMLVDERGVGHVTRRGDFVGVADVVQTGGADSLPLAINWRVDRIRENEVVLAREDPSAPNRPPLIQIIPLHQGADVVDTSITDVREEG